MPAGRTQGAQEIRASRGLGNRYHPVQEFLKRELGRGSLWLNPSFPHRKKHTSV
jgi:hypothetical protein